MKSEQKEIVAQKVVDIVLAEVSLEDAGKVMSTAYRTINQKQKEKNGTAKPTPAKAQKAAKPAKTKLEDDDEEDKTEDKE